MFDPFCPMCGYENEEGARVCLMCGADLEEGEAPETPSENKAAGPSSEEEDGIYKIDLDDDTEPVPESAGVDYTKERLLNNRYRKLKVYYKAGKSTIHEALDTNNGKKVAIKEMDDRFKSDYDRGVGVKAFYKEARRLQNFEHPGLPKVLDFFEEDSRYYVVKEFVEGTSLKERLKKRGNKAYEEDVIIHWTNQILGVFKYLHSLRPPYIYRNLKPSNIMIDNEDNVYLVDYDIDRIFYPKKDEEKKISGFEAPEVSQGYSEPRSDVFSLGVLIRYLYSGLHPDETTRYTRFKRIRDVNNNVSPWFDELVVQMVDPSSQNRPTVDRIIEKMETNDSEFDSSAGAAVSGVQKKEKPMVAPPKQATPPKHIRPKVSDVRAISQRPAPAQKKGVSKEWLALGLIITIPILLIIFVVGLILAPGFIADGHYKKGLSHFDNGEYNKALGQFKKAYETKKSADYLEMMGDSYYKLNDYAQAYSNYRRAADKDRRRRAIIAEKMAEVKMKMGLEAAEKKEYRAAAADFEEALKKNPDLKNIDDVSILETRAIAFYKSKKYKLALDDLDRLIALKDDNAKAYLTRGKVLQALGKLSEAQKDFEKAKKLDPKLALDYYRMTKQLAKNIDREGMDLYKKRRYDQALAKFRKANQMLGGMDANVKMHMVLTYNKMGEKAYRRRSFKAREYYDEALKLDPDNTEALMGMGDFYFSRVRDYKKALEYYKKINQSGLTVSKKRLLQSKIKSLEYLVKRRSRPTTVTKRPTSTPTRVVRPTKTSYPKSTSKRPPGMRLYRIYNKSSSRAIVGRPGQSPILVSSYYLRYLPKGKSFYGKLSGSKFIMWVNRYGKNKTYSARATRVEKVTVAYRSKRKVRKKSKYGRYYYKRTVYAVTLRRANGNLVMVNSSSLYRRVKNGETLYASFRTIGRVKLYQLSGSMYGRSYKISGGGSFR